MQTACLFISSRFLWKAVFAWIERLRNIKWENTKELEYLCFKKQNNDYAILLGKRTIKPNKGKWSIPGGGFEKTDNSLFETAIRELREETGINLSNSVNEKKAIICSFHYPCFEWKTFMFEVASDFHVPERFCYEFSEIKFISLKDIHQYKLAFGVRKEIKKFLIQLYVEWRFMLLDVKQPEPEHVYFHWNLKT